MQKESSNSLVQYNAKNGCSVWKSPWQLWIITHFLAQRCCNNQITVYLALDLVSVEKKNGCRHNWSPTKKIRLCGPSFHLVSCHLQKALAVIHFCRFVGTSALNCVFHACIEFVGKTLSCSQAMHDATQLMPLSHWWQDRVHELLPFKPFYPKSRSLYLTRDHICPYHLLPGHLVP